MRQTLGKAQILELVDSVLRSWWTIVAGLCIGAAAAFTLMHYTDPFYQVTTKIFVAPQKIPKAYIRSTVHDDIGDRLRLIQEAVLSRPYLERVIAASYPGTAAGQPQELLIKKIRSRVQVISRGERYFELKFRDTDANRAANVVNMLADHYIDENARSRRSQAVETTNTLEELANNARIELQEKERVIKEYRAKHMHTLSDQFSANLQLLKGRQMDLDANEIALETARNRLLDLKTQLEREQQANAALPSGAPYADRVALLQEQLSALGLRYSENHPDYKAKQAEIEALTAEARRLGQIEQAGATTMTTPGRPAPDSTEGRIAATERDIARLEGEQAKIHGEIKTYEYRIERTPFVQQELENLTRGVSVLKTKFNQYQAKVEEAKGAQLMEEAQQGTRFEVIERAVPPVLPVTPNRALFGACLAAGLLLFVGPIVAKGFLQPVVASEAGLTQLEGVPLLVSIPTVETPENARRNRLRWLKNFGFSTLSAAILVGVFVVLQ